MIIWSYLMIIWWLFVIIDDYLIIIIRDYLMIIRFPRQQQVVWFASFPKAFARNSGSSWWWQPFPLAYCSLRVSPATCCRSYASSATTILSFMAVSTSLAPCPTEGPLRLQHPSARGRGPSHHAKSDGILHPDHEFLLQWSCVYSPMHSQGCHYRL